MSWIWNVMLSFSNDEYWDENDEVIDEAPPLEKINAWMEADTERNYGPLEDMTPCGGGAEMNANVFGGGFKHFDIEMFIKVVASQQWQDRSSVQIFLQGEEAQSWTILTLPDEAASDSDEAAP